MWNVLSDFNNQPLIKCVGEKTYDFATVMLR